MKSPKKKPWVFEVKLTRDIPRRIGRGQDGDPIYAPLSKEGWTTCLRYFESVQNFLSGTTSKLPSLGSIAKLLPHGTLISIDEERSKEDLFGPKALIVIKDDDRPREKRRPRIFDPVYVTALVMLAAAGGSYRFNDSKSKRDAYGQPTRTGDRRLFVSFGRRAKQNIRVLRIIADPRPGQQIHRIIRQLDSQFHYDHRQSTLVVRLDDSVGGGRHSAGFSRKGRAAAIKAAGEHYERAIQLRGRECVQHLGKSRAEYEKQLTRVFNLADDLHTKLVKRRRSSGGRHEGN